VDSQVRKSGPRAPSFCSFISLGTWATRPLLKLAKSRNIPVISGLEMFVQQGARQFELWTDKPAPEAEMQRVVELELRRRG
jgi:shikimate 5-dehydrogenase